MPNVKNIIIFVAIAGILIFIYIYFFRGDPEVDSLVPSPGSTEANAEAVAGSQDFLMLLLNVRNIKLNDAILADPAFVTLRDSSIQLFPDGNEGRPNPFAPIGSDILVAPLAPVTSFPPDLAPPGGGAVQP